MNKRAYLRQRDLVTPAQLAFPILVIGAGGIGSWATLALTKMGCTNLTVVDFDRVEEHNLPSQLYIPQQISYPKVNALQVLLTQLTGVNIHPVAKAFQEYAINGFTNSFYRVIICAVDSLLQRKEIWELFKKSKQFAATELYVDARIGGEVMKLITINLNDKESIETYEQGLASKVKPYRDLCTGRAVIYNTFMCGGFVANVVKKFAKNETIRPNLVFDIPSMSIL